MYSMQGKTLVIDSDKNTRLHNLATDRLYENRLLVVLELKRNFT